MELGGTTSTVLAFFGNCSPSVLQDGDVDNCSSIPFGIEDSFPEYLTPNMTDNMNTMDGNRTGGQEVDLIFASTVGIVLGTMILLVILGNVLVLLAVFVNSHLRTTTNLFIISLASADLLLATTVLPFSASSEIIGHWVFGLTFCDIWACIDVLCCTASILSLCAISIDRYIGVTKPLQHSTIMTQRRTIWFIVCIWFLSAAIGIGPLIGWKETPKDPDPLACSVNTQIGYVLFSVAGSFYIPATIIVILYIRIYRAAARQSRSLERGFITTDNQSATNSTMMLRVHAGKFKKDRSKSADNAKSNAFQSSSSSDGSNGSGKKVNTLASKIAKFNREKKAAKTLGIVVGVFLLCWFPFFFLLPLGTLCESCVIPDLLFKVVFWLGYCNSLMNPVIYACNSREFKRAFRQILTGRLWRRKRTLGHLRGRAASLYSYRSSFVSRSHSNTDRMLPLPRYQSNSTDSPSQLEQTSFMLETNTNCRCLGSRRSNSMPFSQSHPRCSSEYQKGNRDRMTDNLKVGVKISNKNFNDCQLTTSAARDLDDNENPLETANLLPGNEQTETALSLISET